jgi:hypothetical protein
MREEGASADSVPRLQEKVARSAGLRRRPPSPPTLSRKRERGKIAEAGD